MSGRPAKIVALRALCRYQTHGGYVWAGVMSDGALMCVPCLRENYRLVFTATRRPNGHTGWELASMTHSGESEETEICCNCNKEIWSVVQ